MDLLSNRELEVFELIGHGLSTRGGSLVLLRRARKNLNRQDRQERQGKQEFFVSEHRIGLGVLRVCGNVAFLRKEARSFSPVFLANQIESSLVLLVSLAVQPYAVAPRPM